jgi:hypothetical protein
VGGVPGGGAPGGVCAIVGNSGKTSAATRPSHLFVFITISVYVLCQPLDQIENGLFSLADQR